jgi:hypothetical protein
MADPIVEVVAPVAPVIGTPEYDAAMVAKIDAVQAPVAEPAVKPEGVPDKFWNAATGAVDFTNWGKSTAELEAKFTQAQQVPAVVPPATPVVPAAGVVPPVVPPAAPVGVNMAEITTEFATTGALSEASYAKLAAGGIDKPTVDLYIQGQMALREKSDAVGYETAGGKEAFAQMANWAVVNMTVPERNAFNAALAGGQESMKLAVSGLKSRYEAANGKAPVLVGGEPAVTAAGFQSRAEMTAAMKDPRYSKDPAYRRSVAARVEAAAF